MSWWRFWKKSEKKTFNDPLLKDGRMWLSDLRNLCEMNFDNPEEARRQIRQMQMRMQLYLVLEQYLRLRSQMLVLDIQIQIHH